MAPQTVIEQIHASPLQVVAAVTGGGSAAIHRLLEVPGASRTVLAASVPYAEAALTAYLGAQPEHACHPKTARALAMASFERGRKYTSQVEHLAGIGATASLASDRPKRGEHRIHIAVQTMRHTRVTSLRLEKDARSRAEEEALCADLILNEIAATALLADRLPAALRAGEELETATAVAEPAWIELLLKRCQRVDASTATPSPEKLIFPGAFNPPHVGHREIAALAESLIGEPLAYELSIENVDKPPLDYVEMRHRIASLDGAPLWLTRAATFVKKSQLFPGAVFVVGTDTITRIADPKYYGHDPAQAAAAIERIAAQGCRFLVFGRLLGERFCTLSDVELPERLRSLCRAVPEQTFRNDVSSTGIRQQHES